MIYQRNAQIEGKEGIKKRLKPLEAKSQDSDKGIRLNGFEQIIDMLKVSDSEFRESLLKRLEVKDKKLALSLRKHLRKSGI